MKVPSSVIAILIHTFFTLEAAALVIFIYLSRFGPEELLGKEMLAFLLAVDPITSAIAVLFTLYGLAVTWILMVSAMGEKGDL